MESTNKDNKLTPEILKQIKAELLEKRAQLLNELSEVTDTPTGASDQKNVKFPEFGDKPDDNAQEIDGYTTNLATDKILEDGLRDIESALTRIEAGTYGICKYCKKPINPKRLLARPVASACVECKSKLQSQ